MLLYRDTVDIKASSRGIEVRTDRKWRALDAIDQADKWLRDSVLVGVIATGLAGQQTETFF